MGLVSAPVPQTKAAFLLVCPKGKAVSWVCSILWHMVENSGAGSLEYENFARWADRGQKHPHRGCILGGVFALRAHCALLLDYVPPEEPPSKPLGNALRIR